MPDLNMVLALIVEWFSPLHTSNDFFLHLSGWRCYQIYISASLGTEYTLTCLPRGFLNISSISTVKRNKHEWNCQNSSGLAIEVKEDELEKLKNLPGYPKQTGFKCISAKWQLIVKDFFGMPPCKGGQNTHLVKDKCTSGWMQKITYWWNMVKQLSFNHQYIIFVW